MKNKTVRTIISWGALLGFSFTFCSRFKMNEWQYWAALAFLIVWLGNLHE